MTLAEKEAKLAGLEAEAKPFKDKVKEFDVQIKALKKEIKQEKLDDKYSDFDPILKKYYTFKLPNKKGDDWTDLTGWHGGNSRQMAEKLEKLFDGHEPYDRHIEFDVMETVFDSGLFEDYFEDYCIHKDYSAEYKPEYKDVLSKLNLYDKGELVNFDGLDEEFVNDIKNFIDMYTSIKVSSCIHDW